MIEKKMRMDYETRQRALKLVRPTVDWAFRSSGDKSFQRWQMALRPLVQSGSPRLRRIGRALITAPTPPEQFMRVEFEGVCFEYLGSPHDDLAYTARFDLLPWEVCSRLLWVRLLKQAHFAVDIGASAGAYTLLALSSNPHLRCFAIEPNPSMTEILIRNLVRNEFVDRCCVLSVAASDKFGIVDLGLNAPEAGSGLVSLTEPLSGHGSALVATVPLGTIIAAADVIKIDVERHESAVLLGLWDLIVSQRPVLLMEALTEEELQQQSQTLSGAGYSHPVQVSNAYPQTGDSRNFIWFPESKRNSVMHSLADARAKTDMLMEHWRALYPDVL